MILRKCGWSARIPVSKMAILTLAPVCPFDQSSCAPKRDVTWDFCKIIIQDRQQVYQEKYSEQQQYVQSKNEKENRAATWDPDTQRMQSMLFKKEVCPDNLEEIRMTNYRPIDTLRSEC